MFFSRGSIQDQGSLGKNKPEHEAATASSLLGCWTQKPQPYLGFPTKAFCEEISTETFFKKMFLTFEESPGF